MFEVLIDNKVALADQSLDDDLRRLELERRVHDADLLAGILVAEARGLYGRDGHRSMNAYLRATFNWSTSEANQWRAQARAVGNITGVGDALVAGRIGTSQVAAFARAHSNPRARTVLDQLAPTLVRHAEELSYRDFDALLDHVVRLADEDGAEQDDTASVEGRTATAVAVDGSLYLKATGGDALSTAKLISILDRFVELQFRADVDARREEHGDDTAGVPLPRTDAQRRHDAIHAAFRLANAALDADLPSGTTPDPLVNIVIDDATFGAMLHQHRLSPAADVTGERVDPFTGLADPVHLLEELLDDPDELLNRRCETSNGIRLSPRHILQAALAGHVRRVVVDSRNRVIDYGRKRRLFTGAAREAALVLLRTCEHPGCEVRAEFCAVDHAVEWSAGGPTDQANSGGRCDPHNNDKHRKRWRTRTSTSGRTFTVRADGTIMLPVGARPPVFPDESDDADAA